MTSERLKIGLRENRTGFRPGEEIAGAAHWELDAAPESVEVRLCWFTRGKGTEDTEVAETIPFETPAVGEFRFFFLHAPVAPYSFSGKLISLIWFLELVVQPGNRLQRLEITIAPDAREVVLLGKG